MKINVLYKPTLAEAKKGKFRFYVRLNYDMFPEMEAEFNRKDYPTEQEVQLEEFEDDNDNCEYEKEFDFPYGQVDMQLFFCKKEEIGDEQEELKEVPKQQQEGFFVYYDPKPISEQEQRNMDAAEEDEIKKREHEARLA